MNIEYKAKRRKDSGGMKGNRFYTSLDMAIIKKDAANRNRKIKRGEIPVYGTNYISVCGCGMEGCFLHIGFNPPEIVRKPIEKINKLDWKSVEFLDNYLKEKENLKIEKL